MRKVSSCYDSCISIACTGWEHLYAIVDTQIDAIKSRTHIRREGEPGSKVGGERGEGTKMHHKSNLKKTKFIEYNNWFEEKQYIQRVANFQHIKINKKTTVTELLRKKT